jgi:hypothetical protein
LKRREGSEEIDKIGGIGEKFKFTVVVNGGKGE